MASHCAVSTMNPRDDPLHALFSLSCATGWSVKADVMKQVLRQHFRPHAAGLRPRFDSRMERLEPCPSVALVPIVHLRVVEGLHDDPVVHLGDTWGIRRRAFGGFSLQPGSNRAGQGCRIARHRHRDVTGIHVGVLMQCLDDPVSDIADSRSGATGCGSARLVRRECGAQRFRRSASETANPLCL